jgi:hypothetical protein
MLVGKLSALNYHKNSTFSLLKIITDRIKKTVSNGWSVWTEVPKWFTIRPDSYVSNIRGEYNFKTFYFSFHQGTVIRLQRGQEILPFKSVQTESVVHPASYSMDTGGRSVKLATHLYATSVL